MNDREYQKFLETTWKRPLSDQERNQLHAWLREHPDARVSWNEEQTLNKLLARLPAAPLSSNFTAQVMQALDRESPSAPPVRPFASVLARMRPWALPWAAAGTALVLLFGGSLYWNHQHQQQTVKVAESVRIVGSISALPAPEALKDFELINQLTAVSPHSPDLELLAALE